MIKLNRCIIPFILVISGLTVILVEIHFGDILAATFFGVILNTYIAIIVKSVPCCKGLCYEIMFLISRIKILRSFFVINVFVRFFENFQVYNKTIIITLDNQIG